MPRLRITQATIAFCIFLISPNVLALQTSRLSSGYDIPVIGLGTGRIPPEKIDVAVTAALEDGYRHIDTAFNYRNEEAIGVTLKKWFEKGNKREDLFITTKLPPYGMRPQAVESYLKLSLEKLGLQYVDMYSIHKPFGVIEDDNKHQAAINPNGTMVLDYTTNHLAIWKAMEKQVKEGRTRSIGLCNMNETQVSNVFDNAEIKPSYLQIELQAYNQQKSMRKLCAELNITITAYGTLGAPQLRDSEGIKNSETLPKLLDNDVVQNIAQIHNRTAAQILLRHTVQNGIVVIPRSTNPKRIKENIQIFDFELNEQEMKAMNELNLGEKGRMFNFFSVEKGVEKHPLYPLASQIMT